MRRNRWWSKVVRDQVKSRATELCRSLGCTIGQGIRRRISCLFKLSSSQDLWMFRGIRSLPRRESFGNSRGVRFCLFVVVQPLSSGEETLSGCFEEFLRFEKTSHLSSFNLRRAKFDLYTSFSIYTFAPWVKCNAPTPVSRVVRCTSSRLPCRDR